MIGAPWSHLVFLGFNSRVVALNRDSGEEVWVWKSPKGMGTHVSLLLEHDRLIASVMGYTYCLDPETGSVLWSNRLKGHGYGIPAIVSVNGAQTALVAAAAAAVAQAQAAAAS